MGSDASVRLVLVGADHASDMTGVAGAVLLTDVVSGTADPVLGVLASRAEDVLIHLGGGWQPSSVSHTFLECKSAEVLLLATSLADLIVDASSGLAEKFVLVWDMTGVTW